MFDTGSADYISRISKEKTEPTEKRPGNQGRDEKYTAAVIMKVVLVMLNSKYAKENNHQAT